MRRDVRGGPARLGRNGQDRGSSGPMTPPSCVSGRRPTDPPTADQGERLRSPLGRTPGTGRRCPGQTANRGPVGTSPDRSCAGRRQHQTSPQRRPECRPAIRYCRTRSRNASAQPTRRQEIPHPAETRLAAGPWRSARDSPGRSNTRGNPASRSPAVAWMRARASPSCRAKHGGSAGVMSARPGRRDIRIHGSSPGPPGSAANSRGARPPSPSSAPRTRISSPTARSPTGNSRRTNSRSGLAVWSR